MPRCSSHNSCSVTPGRRSSQWISAQSGCARRSFAATSGGGYKSRSSASSLRFSGSGQLRPARRARRTQSPAAVAPIDRLAAIFRLDMPPARSRSTSRILRMGNLCPGMPRSRSLLKEVEALPIRRSPNGVRHTRPQPGRDRPEWVVAILRNEWSQSIVIGGRNQPVRPILVASSEYIARRGRPNKASHLSNHECLHFRFVRSGKVFKWPISAVPEAPDIRLPTRLTTNENMMLIQAAKRGLGIACVPDFTVREALASGTLCTFLEREVSQEVVWWALWPASPRPSPKLRAFVDFLSQRLQKTSDHHNALV